MVIEKLKKIKDKEFCRYIVGGVIITLSNILLYSILVLIGVKVRYSNLVAMMFAKALGYWVNKFFVYQTKSSNLKEISFEVSKYFSARILTGVIDYFLIVILVEFYGYHPFITKYVVTVIVIILNYLLGKYFVFVDKKTLDSYE